MNLSDQIENHFRISPYQEKALKRLGLETISDILFHLPSRHQDQVKAVAISSVSKGQKVTVQGKVLSQETKKAFRKKIPMAEMVIEDQTGKIKAVWFHQAYMAKKAKKGDFVKLTGTISERKEELYISNPIMEEGGSTQIDSLFEESDSLIVPVYRESRGVSSIWFYDKVLRIMSAGVLDEIEDPIPDRILDKYNLPDIKTALLWIHTPKTINNYIAAQKRFAFEEIFFIQLSRTRAKNEYKANPAFSIEVEEKNIKKFIKGFPFKMTGAQENAIQDILEDLRSDKPMTRLLEGDVGSGKTAVAATTAYGTVMTRPKGQDFGNLQVAYMAPTEILARQHFESFIEYFKHLPVQIGLLTGSECRKFPSKINGEEHTKISRAQLLKWVKNGEVPILIGTHSLIQKTVEFRHLAYVIIDEQHRFGTMQRAKLTRKENSDVVPHLLTMTATPIPRTLALTIYGDLDLTLLDEMPKGRKEVITKVVSKKDQSNVYEKIREEIERDKQAYVICPRIDEPDPEKKNALQLKSAKKEAERLKKEIYPDYEIGLVHSKLKPKDKESVMEEFSNHELDILVATSVVEVGVNVPNATNIIIEGAERFGLAQLHQLRGRVLRSNDQAYCYLFSDSGAQTAKDRLHALTSARNGFELAERDLELRGPGALAGTKQWGISDLGMEAIKNIKMVEAARKEAQAILKKDPELSKEPQIVERLKNSKEIHFE